MSQEETRENTSPNENAINSSDENLNPGEVLNDSIDEKNPEEIDNLPIESIGSYARLEELLIDEESDNTSNPTAQS